MKPVGLNSNHNKPACNSTTVKLEPLVPQSPIASSIPTFQTPIHAVHSYRQNNNKGSRRMYSANETATDTVTQESHLWKQYGLATWMKPKQLAIEEGEKLCGNNEKRNVIKKYTSHIGFIILLTSIMTVCGMNLLNMYIYNYQTGRNVLDKSSQLTADVSSQSQAFALMMSSWMFKTESEMKYLKRSLRQAQSELSAFKKELDGNGVVQHNAVSVDILAELLGPSADFAAEKIGGYIMATPDTFTYYATPALANVLGFQFLTSIATSPSTILKGVLLQPGDCWAFLGSIGRVVIRLARPIHVTAISIEHIPEALSINGNIESAPWLFQLFGTTRDMLFVEFLGEFEYNRYGSSRQTFYTDQVESVGDVKLFEAVEIRFLSNHGNDNYTCIYRTRIHGHT